MLMKRFAAVVLAFAALTFTAAAAEYVIVIDKMAFGPVPETVQPGDTITWQNNDLFRHTATARDGSFDLDLPAGEAASMTVGEPGSIDFFCRFHPGMKGTLLIAP